MGKIIERDYDVVIVGTGFAGLTAARELNMLGRRALLLEARDRIGGRTWMEERLGRPLELGGTYVHWYQPHTWAEIMRYGLEITKVPPAEKVYWITGGKLKSGAPEKLRNKIKEELEAVMRKASEYLPKPFEPLSAQSIKEMDHLPVTEFLDQFQLSEETADFLSSSIGINFHGQPEKGAATQLFRWWAFANGSREIFVDTVGNFKIKEGTGALVHSIASDLEADIQLSTVVHSIKQSGEEVIVSAGGREYSAKTAIVTVPLSVLDKIKFEPSLSPKKQAFIQEKQVSKGVKVWALLKGKMAPFSTYAPADYPMQSIHMEDIVGENTLVVGFGNDAKNLNPSDRGAVEKAIRQWLPDAEVIESTGHDWTHDEFAKETWPMLKPKQLTAYVEEMRRPENRVFLAGTTYADGWAGFIDGAIESGIRTGRMVHEFLEKQ